MESSSFNTDTSSGDDTQSIDMGRFGYMYEPEYTEEELAAIESKRLQQQREIEENPRRDNTSWCSCTKCASMPSVKECTCCHELALIEETLGLGNCVTEKEEFHMVCLNLVVLATAYVSFLRYKRHRGRAPDVLTNRQNRLMAYRQFVCWVRRGQPLGRKNRIPLPSCVVNRIRSEFPLENCEEYEGFHYCHSDSESESD